MSWFDFGLGTDTQVGWCLGHLMCNPRRNWWTNKYHLKSFFTKDLLEI